MIAPAPFLKWAGGKSTIAPQIVALLPPDARRRVYREPFLGGGAMFFYLQPERAFLSDALPHLVTSYEVVRDQCAALTVRLEALRATHNEAQFAEVRARFNNEPGAPAIDRATWLVYLNKTCFNGLYRTNRAGKLNTPSGHVASPRVVDPEALRVAAATLARADLRCADVGALLDDAQPGDMIYLDPPYDPVSKTASFDSYAGAFGRAGQERVASIFRALDERGCLLALSNNDTPLTRELFSGFDVQPLVAPRSISAKGATREAVTEILVRNVARWPLVRCDGELPPERPQLVHRLAPHVQIDGATSG